jgi:hypothetical protein
MVPMNKVARLLVASGAVLGLVAPASIGPAWAGVARPQAAPLAHWQQTAELKGSDTAAKDYFGWSAALSGSTLVVGADQHASKAGQVYVFTKTATGWQQTAKLKGSDTAADDNFGGSVAASGSTIVVGAPGHAGSAGRAYVFTKVATGWQQTAELKGSDNAADNCFGVSVASWGSTLVVGALGHADTAGRAYVFTKAATGWQQTAELKGSDSAAKDEFGVSVASSGSTIVVSAEQHASTAGRVYVFTKTAAGWQQTAELKGSDTAAGDYLGYSVAILGSTIVVGAPGYADTAGRAYVFTKAATGWQQTAELKGFDNAAGNCFGGSVAASGSTLVVGAFGHGGSAGRAYVFVPTTVPASTTTTVPASEHILLVNQSFQGGADLFTTYGSSCSPNDAVQLKVTDQDNRQLSIYTIDAGATGAISGSNCVVVFSFGAVPIIQEYEFWWREPGYSSSWTLASPNGKQSLAEIEGDSWNVSFELEPA